MKISQKGIDLIKSFEGCKLTAYQDTVHVWTIGYGHTGGVKSGQRITKAQAEDFLKADLAKFEKAVNTLKMDFNQNQFDALVSFAYNCGTGNLNKLCKGRTKAEIGSKMLLYNKAGEKVLAGLTRRRNAENKLYNTPVKEVAAVFPSKALKKGDKGADVVWIQQALNKKGYNLVVDGIFGSCTEYAVKDFQTKTFVNGVVDEDTLTKLVR
jgi:GH24 family phage-related lysozyme (muramidase)